MTFLKNSLAAVAVMTMAIAPVTANAAERAVAERAVAETGKESTLSGASWFILPLAIAAIAAAIYIAVDSEDDEPTSP